MSGFIFTAYGDTTYEDPADCQQPSEPSECKCWPGILCQHCRARGYENATAGYAARHVNRGVARCPCCGADHYGPVMFCTDCTNAGCEASRDATGEIGFWSCQLPDTDEFGQDMDDWYGDADSYDRSGVSDGRGHVYSDADPGL